MALIAGCEKDHLHHLVIRPPELKKGSQTSLGLPLGPPEIHTRQKGENCEIIENDENKA